MKVKKTLFLKLIVAAALLWLMYRHVSFHDFASVIRQLQWPPLIAFFLLLFANTLISAFKWQILLRADNVRIPLHNLFSSYLIGTFFNIFLPSNIGGDAYRIYSVGQTSAKMSKSFASVFADRLSGFLALVTLCLVFAMLGFEDLQHHKFIVIPMTLLILLTGMVWSLFFPSPALRVFHALRLDCWKTLDRFVNKVLDSFGAYKHRPLVLIWIMGLSFLFQCLVVVSIGFLARTIRLERIELGAFFVFVPIISLLEAVPITIYGLGFRDWGYVQFFTRMNVANPEAHALTIVILYLGATLLYSCAGAVLFLVRLFTGKAVDESLTERTPAAPGPLKPIVIGIMLRHIDEQGGINVYSRSLLQHILKLDTFNRYMLLVPTPTVFGRSRRYANVTEAIIPVPGIPMRKLAWDQFGVPKHLEQHPADVVFNPKLSVPLGAQSKTIFTMHGLEQFAASRLFVWHDRLYFNIAIRLYMKKADAVIVMTQTGKRDLQAYLNVPAGKIHIIPEAYNEQCRPIRDEALLQFAKDKYALPERYLLFVGGITPLKNIPTLLRAFKELKRRGFRHHLLLVGFRRWKFKDDMALIEELGLQDEVLELGYVDDADLPAIYNLADCFILPSFYEGFGIPILEAQACGCPVVVGNRGAMVEVAGEGGALNFEPGRPQELADRIGRILNDESLRASLVVKGLANAARYGWDITARQTVALFEKIGGG